MTLLHQTIVGRKQSIFRLNLERKSTTRGSSLLTSKRNLYENKEKETEEKIGWGEEYGVAVRNKTVEHQSHWLATCNRPGRERVWVYMALCSGHIERIHRYVTGGYPRVNTRPEASPFEELRFFDLKRAVVHRRLGLSRGIVAGCTWNYGHGTFLMPQNETTRINLPCSSSRSFKKKKKKKRWKK